MTPADFIALIAPAVQEAARRYPGVYASVGIAQAILETGWGSSDLAVKANNYFGVKWHGDPAGPFPAHVTGVYLHRTTERPDSGEYVTDAYFRSYADARGSALDWADNLKSKKVYADAGAWTASDATGFIQAIGKPYTGNDSSYASKVLDIMQRYNLRRYDQERGSHMAHRIIPRGEWGARAARNRTTIAGTRRKAFVLHYHDGRPTTGTGAPAVRGIQNFHMDGNGWSDVGYNFIVDQNGAIFEGRGWDVIGAHAGTGGNAEGIGVQIHIGGAQQPTRAALDAAAWLYDQANKRFGRRLALKGHGDYMSTSCPGGPLRQIVKTGFPTALNSPSAPAITRAVALPNFWNPTDTIRAIDASNPADATLTGLSDVQLREIFIGHGYLFYSGGLHAEMVQTLTDFAYGLCWDDVPRVPEQVAWDLLQSVIRPIEGVTWVELRPVFDAAHAGGAWGQWGEQRTRHSVRAVQAGLNQFSGGAYLAEDGVYGPTTRAAVANWQVAFRGGIAGTPSADGVVGINDFLHLTRACTQRTGRTHRARFLL